MIVIHVTVWKQYCPAISSNNVSMWLTWIFYILFILTPSYIVYAFWIHSKTLMKKKLTPTAPMYITAERLTWYQSPSLMLLVPVHLEPSLVWAGQVSHNRSHGKFAASSGKEIAFWFWLDFVVIYWPLSTAFWTAYSLSHKWEDLLQK